jgi:hypothetical protein
MPTRCPSSEIVRTPSAMSHWDCQSNAKRNTSGLEPNRWTLSATCSSLPTRTSQGRSGIIYIFAIGSPLAPKVSHLPSTGALR